MKNLLLEWEEVCSRIQIAEHILLLCDYDGTLTPIVVRPELAVLSPATKSLLMKLNHLEDVTVGIISGRSLDEVKQIVAIPNLIYAGNHGMEIAGPYINYTIPISRQTWEILEKIKKMLHEQLQNVDGIFIEDKGLTLSVHYRLVEDDKYPVIKNVVENITSQQEMLGRIKLTYGKKVFEIRPDIDWDKGKVVTMLIELFEKRLDFRDFLTIYLGDDRTDEDGFQSVNKTDNGISILVSEVPLESTAAYFLETSEDVVQFLSRLLVTASAKSENQT